MSNRVVHFEIHASDPLRAIKFYKNVFHWQFEKWEGGATPYWMIMTAPKDSTEPGINGGLLPRTLVVMPDYEHVNAFVCTMVVDDYEKSKKMILENGGIEIMPKFAIAGMAWQGYFKDTEGNGFGIHQPDSNAK